MPFQCGRTSKRIGACGTDALMGGFCLGRLPDRQGISGAGTRGNGVPTPLSCFALK